MKNLTGLGHATLKRAQRDYAKAFEIDIPVGFEPTFPEFGKPAQELQRRIREVAALPITGPADRDDLLLLTPYLPRPASPGRTPGVRAAYWAAAHYGPQEQLGKNDGPLIRQIAKALGKEWMYEGGQPWCGLLYEGAHLFGAELDLQAMYPQVSWVYTPSIANGVRAGLVAKGGLYRLRLVALADLRPGDGLLFDWQDDGTVDHIGICLSGFHDGRVRTVEGNTPPSSLGDQSGLASGDGIWPKERTADDISLGFRLDPIR